MTNGILSLASIQRYVDDQVEEGLTLEYKAAAALSRSDGKKREITKDVSAFANAAGGRIIYGMSEFNIEASKHLPERIDPIQRQEFSKEWLGQIIDQIRPRIDGLIITPVSINESSVVYVIDVPQGTTAHQAADYRYYKRRNFESVPMEDYEIRDVMARSSHPIIEITFEVRIKEWEERASFDFPPRSKSRRSVELLAFATNTGKQLARFVNGTISIAAHLTDKWKPDPVAFEAAVAERMIVEFENTKRDLIEVEPGAPGIFESILKYGTSWYAPILPGRTRRVRIIELAPGLRPDLIDEGILEWTVHADNAPARSGSIHLAEVTGWNG